MKNIKFLLPKLDEQETRKAVEKELEKCLFFKLMDVESERKEAKITTSYELRESQRTNQTSDSTADIALHNVSREQERQQHIFRIERAVSRLNKRQRQLITERYLTEFGITDVEVYAGIMEISCPTYIKIRNEAFYMLAFILRVYVEKT